MSTPSFAPPSMSTTSGDSAKVAQLLGDSSSSKQEKPESPRSFSPAQNPASPALSNQYSPFRASSPISKASQSLPAFRKTPELPSSGSDEDEDLDHIILSKPGGKTTDIEKDELVDDIDSLYASDTDFKATEALLASTKPPPSQPNRPLSSQPRRHDLITSTLDEKKPASKNSGDDQTSTRRPPKRKLGSDRPSASPSAALPSKDQHSSASERSKNSVTPAKRSKTAETPQSTPSIALGNQMKHPEFWALDGSVVLQVKNMLFRTSRSMLARKSPYFADLFESNRDVEESIAGCPVFEVTGVEVVDFERLMGAVENGILYAVQSPSFPVIASILRAASDLDFEDYRNWAIHSLENKWPLELPPPSPLSTFRKPISWATDTVNLGVQLDAPVVLKRAFYELVRTSGFGQDVEEAKAVLSGDDILRLVNLREHLQSNWTRIISQPPQDVRCRKFTNTKPSLAPGIQCSDNHHGWFTVITQDPSIQEDGYFDPITGLEDMIVTAKWVEEGGFCKSCVKIWKDIWTKEREKIWNNMDVWLELV